MRATVARFLAFAAISTALTLWIAATVVGLKIEHRYTLTASFHDVAGLYSGNDVRLAGIPVGAVEGIKVVDGQAIVRFSVRSNLHLPADSRAVVRWRNLIGQRFLSLEPGVSTTMLKDGENIAATSDVVDLGRVVNQLAPLAQSIGPDQLNQILTTLVAAFDGNEGNFEQIIGDLNGLSSALADRQALLGQMLSNYATISNAVASRDSAIAAMVSNLSDISQTIAASDGLIGTATSTFATFSNNADRLLAASADDLGGVLDDLAVLMNTATQNVDHIRNAITTFPAMLQALQPTINRGAFLRVNVICIAAAAGPCPYPELFFPKEGPG
jgi:phospholipid/cholesterol/gamma-HCH transport system substrate-binding protein